MPAARDAWLEATEKFIGNPSSPHRLGQRAEGALQNAREQLAGFLGCDAVDIVWTSGATESNNMVFHHLAHSGAACDSEVWVSAIEHPCVQAAVDFHFGKRACWIPVTRDGVVDLDWIRSGLKRKRPALIAVMAANNETGVLQPWREVLALARDSDVPFFCDAAQWVGKLPSAGLGACDFVSGCAHKFGGPKGAGFLKCPGAGQLRPLLLGGQQEEGRRAGTENVAGVLSMMGALESRERSLAAGDHVVREDWRAAFEKRLLEQLPGTEIIGPEATHLWNTVSALMPEADCQQRWVVKLDKFGCAVSTGSACASGREEPSKVLAAMGYSAGQASRMLRFSSGWETSEADWDALFQALAKVRAEVRTIRKIQG